jgi:hypothetical protein
MAIVNNEAHPIFGLRCQAFDTSSNLVAEPGKNPSSDRRVFSLSIIRLLKLNIYTSGFTRLNG